MVMKKRKQHYVWRYYLSAWCVGNQIMCMRDDKIFKSNLMGVGNKRDFYKLKELSIYEISVIKQMFIDSQPNYLKPIVENFIIMFNKIFEIKKKIEESGISKSAQEAIDTQINNIEEDYHAIIESNSIKYLDFLRQNNTSFYNTEEGAIEFNYYLMTQYFRTNYMKEKMSKIDGKKINIDFNKLWNLISHISATITSFNITRQKQFKYYLLKNNSQIPIITGDQPVINIYADYKNEKKLDFDELEIYYPISPNLSFLLSKRNDVEINLNSEQIEFYNNLIFKASLEQIYSNDLNILEKINENIKMGTEYN
jgi:hypothetical protein